MAKTLEEIRNQMKRIVEDVNSLKEWEMAYEPKYKSKNPHWLGNKEQYDILKNSGLSDEEIIRKNPGNIRFIDNPSEELQTLAISLNAHAIHGIENPTENAQLLAVNYTPEALMWIKNPTEDVKKVALSKSGWAINYIKKPTDTEKALAMKTSPGTIPYFNSDKVESKYVIYYMLQPSYNDPYLPRQHSKKCKVDYDKNGNINILWTRDRDFTTFDTKEEAEKAIIKYSMTNFNDARNLFIKKVYVPKQ